MRRYKIDEEVLLNTAALFASPVRTDKWIDAHIAAVNNAMPRRYYVMHDHGSPLWVSDHFLKEKPNEV